MKLGVTLAVIASVLVVATLCRKAPAPAPVALTDPEAVYERLHQDGKKQRLLTLAQLQRDLNTNKEQLASGKFNSQTEALKQTIAEQEYKIEEIKNKEWIVPELDIENLEEGQVGQVLGRDQVPFKTVKVIDKRNVIVSYGDTLFWFQTDNVVKDKKFYNVGVIHVKGQKTYEGATMLELVELPKK